MKRKIVETTNTNLTPTKKRRRFNPYKTPDRERIVAYKGGTPLNNQQRKNLQTKIKKTVLKDTDVIVIDKTNPSLKFDENNSPNFRTPPLGKKNHYQKCDIKFDVLYADKKTATKVRRQVRFWANKDLVHNINKIETTLVSTHKATIDCDDVRLTKLQTRDSQKKHADNESAAEYAEEYKLNEVLKYAKTSKSQLLHMIAWAFHGTDTQDKPNYKVGEEDANFNMLLFEKNIKSLLENNKTEAIDLCVKAYKHTPELPSHLLFAESIKYSYTFCLKKGAKLLYTSPFSIEALIPLLTNNIGNSDRNLRRVLSTFLSFSIDNYSEKALYTTKPSLDNLIKKINFDDIDEFSTDSNSSSDDEVKVYEKGGLLHTFFNLKEELPSINFSNTPSNKEQDQLLAEVLED